MEIDKDNILKPKEYPKIITIKPMKTVNPNEYPNLIHFKPKGDPRSDELRSRQKGSGSDKRKFAQQLVCIKRGGVRSMTAENIEKRALQLATDPKASAITIMQMVQTIGECKDLTTGLRIQLLRAMNDAHRTIHGTKQHISARVESVTVTINEPIERPKDLIENE